MVNIIWGILIVIGIVYGIITNQIEIINNTITNSAGVSLNVFLKIFPVISLWMGLMRIAEKSGLLLLISKGITPFLKKIFPDIPKGHESFSLIASNIISNLFGLGSAATPFGLKAMNSLQKLNEKKDTASRSMITFLVINTCGLTIIPTTIISLRLTYNSTNPTSIIFACLLSTLISTTIGLLIDRFVSRRKKN